MSRGAPLTLKWALTGNDYRLIIDDRVADSYEMSQGRATLRGVLDLGSGRELPVVAEVKQNWTFGTKVMIRVGREQLQVARVS